MLLVREIMHCKPGKVKPMIEKFRAMSRLGEKLGQPKMRIMTDFAGERYWTLIAEFEVPNMEAFEAMMTQGTPEEMKEMEKIMEGYHDLVDYGRREVYKMEE